MPFGIVWLVDIRIKMIEEVENNPEIGKISKENLKRNKNKDQKYIVDQDQGISILKKVNNNQNLCLMTILIQNYLIV